MIRFTTLQKTALSLPEVTEEPHFEKTSFRVNEKICVSYDESHHRACKQGWTFVDMNRVPKAIFVDALKAAYCEVAPKKRSVLIRKNT